MKRTLEKIVRYAASVADPEKIILFGSMARDQDDVFSDVDLLIVSENCEMRKDVEARIRSFSQELSLKIDVLICSQSEMEEASRNPHSFLGEIAKSGRTVYENETCIF